MGDYTHRLTFQAFHDTADLSALPVHLGLAAERFSKAGEPRITPNGVVTGAVHRFSACSIVFDPKPGESLPESLASAVARLKPHTDYLAAQSASGVRFQFFIGWFSDFNSRDVLDWTLLGALADLKISLDVDFYGPDESQAERRPASE